MDDVAGALRAGPRPPSVPYGQACMACSKAKTRCIGRGPETACERCRRLSRQCQPSAVLRKGRTHKRPKPNNAAVLEKKLDDLVNLLSIRNSRSTGESSSMATEENHVPVVEADSGGLETEPGPPTTTGVSMSSTNVVTGLNAEPRNSTEDDECLKTFRELHLQSFPILHIPPETTSSQLRSEKPVLFLAMSTICSKSNARRRALELKFRSVIAQRYVVQFERSIDILLGLITFISWIKCSYPDQRFTSSYSSMISSLVFDLRLDRVGRWAICKETESTAAFIDPLRLPLPPIRRTYEERRAAIAAYCTCATVQLFLRTPPMRWTPHLQDSLIHLSKEPEVPGDEVLAAMASAFRIGEDVIAASGWRFFEPQAYNPSKPPPMVHVKALLMGLGNLRQSLRQDILENRTVQVNLLFIEASINELPLQPRPRDAPGSSWIDIGRAECFHACIEAVGQLLRSIVGFTPQEIFGMHTGPLIQYALATHMVYRLAMAPHRTHNNDANGGGGESMWDSRAVRAAVDLPEMMDKTSQLFLAVPAAVGLQDDGMDPYTLLGTMLRNVKAIWSKAFEQAEAGGVAGDASAVGGGDDGMADGWMADGWMGMDDLTFLEFGGDLWMSDVGGI